MESLKQNKAKVNTTLVDLALSFGTTALDFNQEPTQTIADALLQPERADDAVIERLLAKASDRLSLFTAPASIGQIMDIPAEEAAELVNIARAEMANGLRGNIMIIEDEPIIAADIEGLVEDLGHVVDNIAATHSEAVKAAEQKRPGIVLADVQLADGSSGIDAVSDILKKYNVPVIFITAFPERFLTGDKPEPAYLISKPFRPENVKAAISQALFFHEG